MDVLSFVLNLNLNLNLSLNVNVDVTLSLSLNLSLNLKLCLIVSVGAGSPGAGLCWSAGGMISSVQLFENTVSMQAAEIHSVRPQRPLPAPSHERVHLPSQSWA